MDMLILATWSPEHTCLIIALIAAWMVLMCLKTLGHGYFTAVCWHNLKVQAHDLRIRHENELRDMKHKAVLKEVKRHSRNVDGHIEESGIEETPSQMSEAGDGSEMPAKAA